MRFVASITALTALLLTSFQATSSIPSGWLPQHAYLMVVKRVTDGDTVVGDVQLGMNVMTHQALRLYGINAPEMTGDSAPDGKISRVALQRLINKYAIVVTDEGPLILVRPQTVRSRPYGIPRDATGRYGRFLVTLVGYDHETASEKDLNAAMVQQDYAVPYFP